MRFGRIARASGDVVFARIDELREETGAGGGRAVPLTAAPWEGGVEAGDAFAFAAQDLRAPSKPTKIVAIGRNYVAHAKELGHEVPSEPLLFLKAPSASLDPGGTIVRPRASSRVEHEAELGVVIGRRARCVEESEALEHVFGYVALCDVTARDLQRKDVQFTRAKSFDTFCPFGPWIETSLDPRDVSVRARVNGVVKQDGRTRDMLFPVAMIVAYVSRVMTLEPGDVIATGTPEGVGPIVAGDVVEVEVEGVGVLRCSVADE
jgi:2-keto-4-pentenoate hydratase/2-oxohepta-3-ene-1,7-dioic acid hydratase in catechol pathway